MKTQIVNDFSESLKILRKAQHWSQADLARCAGVTRMSIWTLESGKREPSLSTLLKLARPLGCTLDELVGRFKLRPVPKHDIRAFKTMQKSLRRVPYRTI